MSELIPLPLDLLLKRAFQEYEREGKIFDLPKSKFFRGDLALDTSVRFHGYTAATPIGPAAGPHDQMLQNIVLSWLGGSRIIELKTVQILDELKIPRPCIDMTSVGYNVEWSQELKLELSLREYVAAAMFIEILNASGLLGEEFPVSKRQTIYDMSVGYSLDGISSPRVRWWIDSMKDATAIINELRAQLAGEFAPYRDLPFPSRISDSVTLSTFHGCPADEIERICNFLLTEMDVHVCIKMNPTLLGKPEVEHLLHDVMGYHDIEVTQEAFDKDLQFSDALEIVARLDRVARSRGKRLAVKFSNTLVVKNYRTFFTDEVMYMSGAPLHVITLNLVRKFREHVGDAIPISFSAGIDANNVASAVAMNFVPVTSCTDLLRPGGYGRLYRYMDRLEAAMKALGVCTIGDFVLRYCGQSRAAVGQVVERWQKSLRASHPAGSASALAWIQSSLQPRLLAWAGGTPTPVKDICSALAREFSSKVLPQLPGALAAELGNKLDALPQALVDAAGVLNTPLLVDKATADHRYSCERNRAVPRKIGSKLYLYDCINCDKCVPVCPNDANFVYEDEAVEVSYHNYRLAGDGRLAVAPGGTLKIAKGHQLANYADFCNDCGNCDVFCPEDGGPYIEKPRFFGSLESYQKYAKTNGFFVEYGSEQRTIYGTIGGKAYSLCVDSDSGHARFSDGAVELDVDSATHQPVSARRTAPAPPESSLLIDMLPYHQLRLLLDAVSKRDRLNYVNVRAHGTLQ
jgi:putative selenate reductase